MCRFLDLIKVTELASKVIAYCAPGYLWLGEFYLDTGQKEKSLETLQKAQGIYQDMGMDYWLTKTHKILKLLGS